MDARVLRRESEASVYLLKDKVQGSGSSAQGLRAWGYVAAHLGLHFERMASSNHPKLPLIGYDVQAWLST